MLPKPFISLVFQNHKLLIGRRFQVKCQPLFVKKSLQPFRHLDRIPADIQVQVVRKKRVELNAQQPSFRQHRSMLLHHCHKMLRRVSPGKYHSFSAESSHLRSADVKYIADFSYVREFHVCLRTHQSIAKTGPVQKERYLVFMTYDSDILQFLPAVQRTVLCRPGQINHSRKDLMFIAFILIKIFQICPDLSGVQLALMFRQRQHLVSGIFDRSGLMGIDVACLRRNHALV